MLHHQEEEFLPWSNQKYSITYQGIVKENGKPIVTTIINNDRMVELDWYGGKKLYRYDIIPIVCYFKIKLPQQFLDRVELLYKDSNRDNLCVDNLGYRFIDGLIEHEKFQGYYYIPYYTDYVINRAGDTIGLKLYKKRGFIKHKKWSISKPVLKKNIKGGYYCGRGKRDHDSVNGVSRHRFLALTFIPYLTDPLSLVVNHKNGIPGNDWLDNLEWATYSENTLHAYQNGLHKNKTVKLIILNEKTGIEKRYSSGEQCVRETGYTRGFINGRLKNGHVNYLDGIRIKVDDSSDWPLIVRNGSSSFIQPVVVRNVFTDDILIFENITKAERYTNVVRATISYHCNTIAMTPIGGYCFRYVNDSSDESKWPHRSEFHLRMYRRFPVGLIPTGLFLLDDENHIVAFYECFEDFILEARITLGSLLYKLKKGKTWKGLHLRKFDVKGTL